MTAIMDDLNTVASAAHMRQPMEMTQYSLTHGQKIDRVTFYNHNGIVGYLDFFQIGKKVMMTWFNIPNHLIDGLINGAESGELTSVASGQISVGDLATVIGQTPNLPPEMQSIINFAVNNVSEQIVTFHVDGDPGSQQLKMELNLSPELIRSVLKNLNFRSN
jgi:hypothetical protein